MVLALILDSVCVVIATIITAYRYRFYSPLTIYLFFHIYGFSNRFWQVYLGAPTMYEMASGVGYDPIRLDEITRAMILADVGLIMFLLGTAAVKMPNRSGAGASRPAVIPARYRSLMLILLVIFAGAGASMVVLNRYVLTDDGNERSVLQSISSMVALWTPCALISIYFLTRQIYFVILPLILYFSIVGLQGYHRFMLILPLISLVTAYLLLHRKRWPDLRSLVVLGLLFVVFPKLKLIGKARLAGDRETMVAELVDSFTNAVDTDLEKAKGGFLDMFAGFLTMTDQYGSFEFGRSYTYILTIVVPRVWWPEKPGLGDHIIKRATDARPYHKEGRTISYLGEAYVNFGYLGIVFVPFTIAFGLRIFEINIYSPTTQNSAKLFAVLIVPSLLQVFRDGTSSLFLFGLIMNFPAALIWFIGFCCRDERSMTNLVRGTRIPASELSREPGNKNNGFEGSALPKVVTMKDPEEGNSAANLPPL